MGEDINADSLLLTCKVFQWLADDYLEITYKAKAVHNFTPENAYRYITNAKYNTTLLGESYALLSMVCVCSIPTMISLFLCHDQPFLV